MEFQEFFQEFWASSLTWSRQTLLGSSSMQAWCKEGSPHSFQQFHCGIFGIQGILGSWNFLGFPPGREPRQAPKNFGGLLTHFRLLNFGIPPSFGIFRNLEIPTKFGLPSSFWGPAFLGSLPNFCDPLPISTPNPIFVFLGTSSANFWKKRGPQPQFWGFGGIPDPFCGHPKSVLGGIWGNSNPIFYEFQGSQSSFGIFRKNLFGRFWGSS